MNDLLKLLKENKVTDFVDTFDKLNVAEKKQQLTKIVAALQQAEPPNYISVLSRKLHPNKNFQDFYNAWMPPEQYWYKTYGIKHYFNFPTKVFNAENIINSSEILSTGFMTGDFAALTQAMEDMTASEKVRADNISKVADKQGKTEIYKILSIDNLGI